MPAASPPAPSAPRALLPVVAIIFGGFLAVGLPLPVLPLRVHDDLGFGAVTVGITVGLQSVATVATRGFAGRVADRRGPRAAVLTGLPAAALAGLAYLASTVIPSPALSLAVILVGRLLTGFAESLFLTGTMTWGIGRLGVQRTGTVMAWQGFGLYAALSAGAPAGVAIADRFGFTGVGAAVMLAPLAALLVALALPGTAPTGGRRAGLSFPRALALVRREGVVLALSAAPFAGLSAFVALDYAARGWAGAGLALTGFGIGFMALRVVGGTWPDTLGARPVAVGSLAVAALGQVLMGLAPHPAVSIAGAVLSGAGSSLVFPALGVAAVRRAPAESRGLAFGAFVAYLDTALALVGPLLGLVVGVAGFSATYAAGVAACAAGLAAVLMPERR